MQIVDVSYIYKYKRALVLLENYYYEFGAQKLRELFSLVGMMSQLIQSQEGSRRQKERQLRLLRYSSYFLTVYVLVFLVTLLENVESCHTLQYKVSCQVLVSPTCNLNSRWHKQLFLLNLGCEFSYILENQWEIFRNLCKRWTVNRTNPQVHRFMSKDAR